MFNTLQETSKRLNLNDEYEIFVTTHAAECILTKARTKCKVPWESRAIREKQGGARGVMVIVVGNGHGDTSSNPGRG